MNLPPTPDSQDSVASGSGISPRSRFLLELNGEEQPSSSEEDLEDVGRHTNEDSSGVEEEDTTDSFEDDSQGNNGEEEDNEGDRGEDVVEAEAEAEVCLASIWAESCLQPSNLFIYSLLNIV